MAGRLEVICGPMFSGKSEELLRRLRRAEIAGHKVVLVKPAIDDRYDKQHVVSHAGTKMPAMVAQNIGDVRLMTVGYSVVGIDEVQFFGDATNVPTDLNDLALGGKIVIVSGLDMTYRAEPFGVMPELLAIADRVDKLSAVCHSCGKDATRTQRLIDGKPAPFQGPTVQVGGLDTYEARCRDCFERG